jgi:hypothetical protein
MSELPEDLCPSANIVLAENSRSQEIAAIMNYENTTTTQVQPRRLMIIDYTATESYVPTVSQLWEPLAYPLLFPHGKLGWGINSCFDGVDVDMDTAVDDSHASTQIWHYRMRLLHEERFAIFGQLTNEYLVDMLS